jgi:hypothetical protein
MGRFTEINTNVDKTLGGFLVVPEGFDPAVLSEATITSKYFDLATAQ